MRHVYSPSKKELKEAYNQFSKKKNDKEIALHLGISDTLFRKNKDKFYSYFRQRDEKKSIKAGGVARISPNKGNRKFTVDKREQLLICLEHEMTVELASKIVGVHRDTVYAWCKEYPAFKREMDNAREVGILRVKKANMKSAIGGYDHEVITKEHYDNKGNLISKERIVKKVPIRANVSAQEFFLINRAGWVKDNERKKDTSNNKGKILETLDILTKEK